MALNLEIWVRAQAVNNMFTSYSPIILFPKKNTEGKGNVYVHKECVTREKGETIALSKIKIFSPRPLWERGWG